MAKNDLRKGAAGGGGAGGGIKALDPGDPWDADVLAEAALLQAWTGVKATLVHVDDGTAACGDGTVCVDRAQLDGLFKQFGAGSEKYKTAIFFALAHEFGHLCQFAVYVTAGSQGSHFQRDRRGPGFHRGDQILGGGDGREVSRSDR